MQMKCIDVFTGADGRREYRLQYLVEQTAPVIFKLGRRYELVEPSGIRSQLESKPAAPVELTDEEREDLFMTWLRGRTPDDLDRMAETIQGIFNARSDDEKKAKAKS